MPARRSSATRSLVWLRDSATPLFALNAQRRVTLFNRGCEVLTGWQAADVLGKRTETTSEADPSSIAALLAALAAPAEAWRSEVVQIDVELPRRELPPIRQRLEFWPIRDPDGDGLQVLLVQMRPATGPSAGPIAESAAQRWHRELAALRFDLRRRYGEKSLIGRCPSMSRVLEQVRLARHAAVPVFLCGESGTGKDHVARAIHLGSSFENRAFVLIDGRTTPGVEVKRILRQLAQEPVGTVANSALHPGTLFITDVEALAADVQERLSAWLQTATGVRVIASSEHLVERLVQTHALPSTLAWQLSPLTIELPPLRERDDDLLLLAQYFLEELNRGCEQQVTGFADDVIRGWQRYRWPGNLDELWKVVQETHAACGEGLVQVEHLPFRFRSGVDAQTLLPRRRQTRPLDDLLERVERDELRQAVQEAGGNLTQAADLLKIPRARLYRRLEQLGLRNASAPATPTSHATSECSLPDGSPAVRSTPDSAPNAVESPDTASNTTPNATTE